MIGEDRGGAKTTCRSQRSHAMNVKNINLIAMQMSRKPVPEHYLIEGFSHNHSRTAHQVPLKIFLRCRNKALGVYDFDRFSLADKSSRQFVDVARDTSNVGRQFTGD